MNNFFVKRIALLFVLCFAFSVSFAQTVKLIDHKGTIKVLESSQWSTLGTAIYKKNTGTVVVGDGTLPTNLNSHAAMQFTEIDKGILIPRVSLQATSNYAPFVSLAVADHGLLVYNIATAGTSPNNVIPGFYYWDTNSWKAISSTIGTPLNSGQIIVGNASNKAAAVDMSGDASISNTGVLTLANTSVTAANYGNATTIPNFTVNAKGLITAAGSTAIPTLNQNTTGSSASFTGNLSGDVTGTQSATVVQRINGTSLAGLTTGLLKNTISTGVPTIAVVRTDYAEPTTALGTGLLKNTTSTGAHTIAVAGTDYVIPSGSITGNAATATTATSFTGSLAGDVSGTQSATTIGTGKVNSTHILDGTIATADIANANITYDKIQNVSATDIVLGRVTAGAGIVEEISTIGSGNVVRANSPILVTPNIGAATGTSLSVTGNLIAGSLNSNSITYPNTNGSVGQVLTINSVTSGNAIATWATSSNSGSGTITDDASNATVYPTWVSGTGTQALKITSSKLSFNPSTGDAKINGITVGLGKLSYSTNTVFGVNSLNTLSNALGVRNTAIGYNTLSGNYQGSDNTAVGNNTLLTTQGSYNTAVGSTAEVTYAGTNSTVIGYGASVTNGSVNSTAIGNGATVSTSNMIRFGNGSITVIQGQVGFSASSDIRLKRDISDTKYGLNTIMQLRPVDYTLKSNQLKQVGFIAQEVQKLVPEVVTGTEGDLEKGETLGLTYGSFTPILTKAIQEQEVKIIAQEDQNTALQIEVAALKAQLKKQESIALRQQTQIDELKDLLQKVLERQK